MGRQLQRRRARGRRATPPQRTQRRRSRSGSASCRSQSAWSSRPSAPWPSTWASVGRSAGRQPRTRAAQQSGGGKGGVPAPS
eukprot:785506-Lingulodinium_polyedra.AAC.1